MQIDGKKIIKVDYLKLNSKAKENYNFHKIGAVLADYGFASLRLSDDWGGADFIAQHIDGNYLKVQLKSRLTFDRKYEGKDIYIAFPHAENWFLYPHDELLQILLDRTNISGTSSWKIGKKYSWNTLSQAIQNILEPYKL